MDATNPSFDVLWPRARATQQRVTREGHLTTVEGKTIAFIWDYVFRGDQMFEIVKDRFAERAADVSFVDYSVFGDIHGADERALMASLPDRLREHEADAAIVGVGA